jgi:DNA-binding NarL/FixJ family response regulator
VVEDGRQLIEAAARLRPDVIVAGITMPHLNGVDALTRLRADGNQVPVVFLTMHREATFVEFHNYQMMETLDLHTNAELIHFAIKNGLVEL